MSQKQPAESAKQWLRMLRKDGPGRNTSICGKQMFDKRAVGQSSQALTTCILSLGRDKVRLASSRLTGHSHFRKHLQMTGIFPKEPFCRLSRLPTKLFCARYSGSQKEEPFRALDIKSSEFPYLIKVILEVVRDFS